MPGQLRQAGEVVSGTAFQVVGDSLIGRGLSLDVALLVAPEQTPPVAERSKQLAEVAEVAYREGRTSRRLSYDDRSDLHGIVDALHGLAAIVGSIPGDRYRRGAAALARLLQDQAGGG